MLLVSKLVYKNVLGGSAFYWVRLFGRGAARVWVLRFETGRSVDRRQAV